MSRKYKFGEKSGAYFISFATVSWIDVFTRDPDRRKCITCLLPKGSKSLTLSSRLKATSTE